jgi:hypothetical protein
VVFVGTVAIGLTVFEIGEEAEFRYVKGDYVRASELPPTKRYDEMFSWVTTRETASGRLAIRAYSPYGGTSSQQTWHEDKPGKLVRDVRAIVQAVEEAAPEVARLAEEAMRKAEEESRRGGPRSASTNGRSESVGDRRRRGRAASSCSRSSGRGRWRATSSGSSRTPSVGPASCRTRAEARQLLGGLDPLRHFSSWKSPSDRVGRHEDASADPDADAAE